MLLGELPLEPAKSSSGLPAILEQDKTNQVKVLLKRYVHHCAAWHGQAIIVSGCKKCSAPKTIDAGKQFQCNY